MSVRSVGMPEKLSRLFARLESGPGGTPFRGTIILLEADQWGQFVRVSSTLSFGVDGVGARFAELHRNTKRIVTLSQRPQLLNIDLFQVIFEGFYVLSAT